ncbi:MAG: hypothetical protein ACT4OO_01875 [Nitrospiraceae bacterium]
MVLVEGWENYRGGRDQLHERLAVLEEAIVMAPDHIRDLLSNIHASALETGAALEQLRVSRSPLPRPLLEVVRCFNCETTEMSVFHTSKQGGYHLCPACFQRRVEGGRARSVE